MTLEQILILVQVILSVLLVMVVLLQSRGASLGEAWGGSSTFYTTRRGVDRTLFIITIVLAVLFAGTALALIFI
ncbi:MAG: preprotein translocase subunit SecG [Patescibacteria group bacterium]|nr:preprotein translocase subunit SecG [Patescibacteria group bacterium]